MGARGVRGRQRIEGDGFPAAVGEGDRQEVIEEGGVFREDGPVEVGADGVARDRALGPVRAVVAEAVLDSGEGAGGGPR